jgi:hypothetical protein
MGWNWSLDFPLHVFFKLGVFEILKKCRATAHWTKVYCILMSASGPEGIYFKTFAACKNWIAMFLFSFKKQNRGIKLTYTLSHGMCVFISLVGVHCRPLCAACIISFHWILLAERRLGFPWVLTQLDMRDLSDVIWLSSHAIYKQLDMRAARSWAAPARAAFESFPHSINYGPIAPLVKPSLGKLSVMYNTLPFDLCGCKEHDIYNCRHVRPTL